MGRPGGRKGLRGLRLWKLCEGIAHQHHSDNYHDWEKPNTNDVRDTGIENFSGGKEGDVLGNWITKPLC